MQETKTHEVLWLMAKLFGTFNFFCYWVSEAFPIGSSLTVSFTAQKSCLARCWVTDVHFISCITNHFETNDLENHLLDQHQWRWCSQQSACLAGMKTQVQFSVSIHKSQHVGNGHIPGAHWPATLAYQTNSSTGRSPGPENMADETWWTAPEDKPCCWEKSVYGRRGLF